MNLTGAGGRLPRISLVSRTWYRAVRNAHRGQPLHFMHTSRSVSRFNSGSGNYHLLYLSPSPRIALLEVQALVATFTPPTMHLIDPRYAVFPVSVALDDVVDFGASICRARVTTSVQELTGDWQDYPRRRRSGAPPAVRSRDVAAPTQELGAALAGEPSLEAFLAPSAKAPDVSNLVVFPHRVSIDHGERRIRSRRENRARSVGRASRPSSA